MFELELVLDKKYYENYEKMQKVKKYREKLLQDMSCKRKMVDLVETVYSTYFVQIKEKKGDLLKMQVFDEMASIFGLETEKQKLDLHIDFYGLTGSGFQMKDTHIKIMLRHNNYQDMIDKHLIPKIKSN